MRVSITGERANATLSLSSSYRSYINTYVTDQFLSVNLTANVMLYFISYHYKSFPLLPTFVRIHS